MWQQVTAIKVSDAFTGTPLSAIRREHGIEKQAAYISAWLISINRIFNLPDDRKLNEHQIKLLTDVIMHEYYYLTEVDLKLIHDKVLRSENFARLDPNVIVRILDDHCSDRHETAESMQIQSQEARQREDVKYIALNTDELKKIGKL